MLEEQLISDQEWVEELFGYFPAPEPATDVPPEERTQLTLVGVAVQEGFSMIVEGFNRSNPRYYVTLTDYGWNSSDKKQGLTTLQTKLMAGQFPDMLYFSLNVTEGAMRDERFLSPLPLISKGLLLDLDPLLEADPDINKEDIAGWKGLHEYGGLYLLPPDQSQHPAGLPSPLRGTDRLDHRRISGMGSQSVRGTAHVRSHGPPIISWKPSAAAMSAIRWTSKTPPVTSTIRNLSPF